MLSTQVQQIVEILLDESTPASTLRKIVEDHELNPNCQRKCALCSEFCELEFEYIERQGSGFTVLPLYFFGDAVVNHINCDTSLYRDINKWILKKSYGDWTRSFDQAAISNPNASHQRLLEVGKETVNGYELILVKNHPSLTKEIEKEILRAREWKRWPKRSLLIDNLCIDNEDDDFESVRIHPRSEVQDMPTTTFENKAIILGQLWTQFKGEDDFADFFEYNDLGLPLAFALAEGIVKVTPKLEQYINETWDLFIEGLDLEDTGFKSLDNLLGED
jgi:hypothetical protein